jgi:phosphatidylglycerol:prolipoprotein diacylglycerol transferase
MEILNFRDGGLAIYGGLIFGAITLCISLKIKKINVLDFFDRIVPCVAIAQAIGRWGNFFNGEAFGTAVPYDTLINLKVIPQFIIDNMYINGEYHLPMFFFESIICFLGFIIMLFIRRRKYIKVGQITGFYLIWYGVLRFIIEIFRTDSLMLLNIKVAQVVSVIMVIVGLSIIFTQSKKPKLEELYNTAEEDIRF